MDRKYKYKNDYPFNWSAINTSRNENGIIIETENCDSICKIRYEGKELIFSTTEIAEGRIGNLRELSVENFMNYYNKTQ